MNIINYPRLLVIANNSFSLTSSNGRTLGNFLVGWPKDSLAQFCISTDGPNFDLCDNYYCLPDRSMLNACIYFKNPKRLKFEKAEFDCRKQVSVSSLKKTALNALLRNAIWMSRKWNNKEFNQWIQEFNPDVVLFQSGDSIFMLDIALKISQKWNIPLVLFNTEGYYFFKHNYMFKGVGDFIFFPLYQALYRQKYRKLMKHVSSSIYGNSLLKEDYDREFGGHSLVLYTSSTLKSDNAFFDKEHLHFTYLGNLGFDRPNALIEIGDVLQSINKEYYLDIYGRALPEMKKKFESSRGIRYHGFITYDTVLKVIKGSDVLFHAESQNDRWKETLRYGFSTKIADSIASGKTFVLYSSSDIACAHYIKNSNAGWFASNKEDLKKVLETIIFDKVERDKKLSIARKVYLENHFMKKNSEIFYRCIQNVVVRY